MIYDPETWSNRPIWWHYMAVGVPDVLQAFPEVAYMLIDGGSNRPGSQPPSIDSETTTVCRMFANQTGYPGAVLLQVPNQGIIFVVSSYIFSTKILNRSNRFH